MLASRLIPPLPGLAILVLAAGVGLAAGVDWEPQPVKDDPLVRMPGTQPEQRVTLEGPDRCLNCHSGYDPAVEPGFHWQGSMMAQAARDPIFWACLTVSAQDAIWALGNPNATDICLRCHFPSGWLEGRSDPTNASLMTGSDYDGLHCDFCHRLYDPFARSTHDGSREGKDWAGYWDESDNTGPGSKTLSQTEADRTLADDLAQQPGVRLFSGETFFANDLPRYASYDENTSGQFFASTANDKRASFADATGRHGMRYSRYHKSRNFCAACHDVSNPVLANLRKPLPDQSGGKHLITEQYPAARYFHVERTFSEFALSAYGRPGGAATTPEFRQQGAPTIAWAAKCQDCHMRDVVGQGADKRDAVLRPTGSKEHPASGQPLHDLSGGNAWVTRILASLDPNHTLYDKRNADLLGQGPAVLTLDLNAGESPVLNGKALEAGSERALAQLKLAATITDLTYTASSGRLLFRVQNNTGHKLISGFPEGRRMWVNIRTYRGPALFEEINPYDDRAGTLRGLPSSPNAPPLGPNEKHLDRLVYEMKPSSDLTGENKTFHFVLATGRYKDNRIPPRGFDIQKAAARLCEPAWDGRSDPGYFTAAEYAGGYDEVDLLVPAGADRVVVTLYYQGTSREYVEFLRDEINGSGKTLPPAAYIVQTDPFFGRLKGWGNVIWDLWFHNHGLDANGPQVPGIVPVAMAAGETGPVGPRLRHTGSATPGGAIQVEIQGTPNAPVVWSVSLVPQMFDPPIMLPGITGGFYLQWPFVLVPVGSIPPGGVATFPLSIPTGVPVPSVFPTQAVVGLELTNPDPVTVTR